MMHSIRVIINAHYILHSEHHIGGIGAHKVKCGAHLDFPTRYPYLICLFIYLGIGRKHPKLAYIFLAEREREREREVLSFCSLALLSMISAAATPKKFQSFSLNSL